MPRAYLDHASTSPLRPAAFDAMLPYLRDHFGDPGRLHDEGRTTRVAVEIAREQVAALFGARPREVVFTSSGTESVCAAVYGALTRGTEHGRTHIVTTAVEHSSVLEAAHRDAATRVTVVGVDRLGHVDADALLAAIDDDDGAGLDPARQPRGGHDPGRRRRRLGRPHPRRQRRARARRRVPPPPVTCRWTSPRSMPTCAR